MGALTNDMMRLRQEIRAMRGARTVLLDDLARGAKEMKESVAVMQAGFRRDHAAMAEASKAGRVAFVCKLKTAVSRMRKTFACDLEGARKVWLGDPAKGICAVPEAISQDVGVDKRTAEAPVSQKKVKKAVPLKVKPLAKKKRS